LEHADFLLHAGDKVALVGPNGSGKSTLFRLLAGETAPDLGDLVLKPGLRYGYLPQVPNVPPETAVRDVLSAPSPAVSGTVRSVFRVGFRGGPKYIRHYLCDLASNRAGSCNAGVEASPWPSSGSR